MCLPTSRPKNYQSHFISNHHPYPHDAPITHSHPRPYRWLANVTDPNQTFSFQYPDYLVADSMTLTESPTCEQLTAQCIANPPPNTTTADCLLEESHCSDSTITITLHPLNSTNVQDLTEQILASYPEYDQDITSTLPNHLRTIDAKSFIYHGMSPDELVIIPANQQVIKMLFTNDDRNLYQQILPTFKFIDTSSTPSSTKINADGTVTYTHNQCGTFPASQIVPFTYTIPQNMKESIGQTASCCTNYSYKSPELTLTITCGDGFGGGGCGLMYPLIQNQYQTSNGTTTACLENYPDANHLSLRLTYLQPTPPNPDIDYVSISVTAQGLDTQTNRQIITNVLSTFKFTD